MTDFAAVDLNLTVEAEVKLVPVIVTVLPHLSSPDPGDSAILGGSSRCESAGAWKSFCGVLFARIAVIR